ncbi:MAG: preprotein translocase subunit SecE [Patescibacteria group bacterium]
MFERLKIFLKESQEEWQHVNWPPRSEALYLTGVVIGFSVLLAAILGIFDALAYYALSVIVIGG